MGRFFDALQRSQAERSGADVSALPGATEAKEGGEQENGLEWEIALKVHGKNIAQVYSEMIEPPAATELKESVKLKENVEREAGLERETTLRPLGEDIPRIVFVNHEPPGATELKESVEQEGALEGKSSLRRLSKNIPRIEFVNIQPPGAAELEESVGQATGLGRETALPGLGENIPQVDPEHIISRPFDSVNDAPPSAKISAAAAAGAIPTITWPTPDQICYGNKLTFAQLNAAASVEGSFTYTPEPGDVLPAGTHTLRVRFTPADSGGHAAREAEVSIVVARATPALSWPTPGGILYGTALSEAQLNASASVPGRFDYSPALGEVLPPGTHTLSVTFTPEDSANCAAAQASVSLTVTKATSVIHWPTPDAIPYGTPLGSAQLCAVASIPGTFEYDPGLGAVLAAGEHTLSVVFTPEDSLNYSASRTVTSLSVTRATSVVHWPTPDPIPYGTPLSAAQLCAVASVPGTFEYDPGLEAVLAVGEHKLSLVFTPEDSLNYSTSRAAASLSVAKATSVIQWPTPDPITYGTQLSDAQLRAVASVPGTFEYHPGSGAVVAAGEHKLSVVFTPEDAFSYSTSQAAASLSVAKATPAITWPTPDAIVHGAAINAAQLNATTTVPGSFAYAPAAGEILQPGVHQLSVIFTPIDSLNYTTASATVLLTITEKLPAAILRRETDRDLFQSFSAKKVKVKVEHKKAGKKWAIVAGVSACLILILLILMFARSYYETTSVTKPSNQPLAVQPLPAQPLPESADTQPTPNTPEPAASEPLTQDMPPATTDKQQATDKQPDVGSGVKPAEAPTYALKDPLTAPPRIPKQVAENTPPPPSLDRAGTDGLGGGGANASMFNGHAQPTVRVTRPVPISSGIAAGMLIQSPPPVYPPLAKTAHVAGTVEVHATIATNGTIKDLRAVSGPAMLRQAAVDAVRNWRYRPYKLDNQPVEVETTIEVVFSLGG